MTVTIMEHSVSHDLDQLSCNRFFCRPLYSAYVFPTSKLGVLKSKKRFAMEILLLLCSNSRLIDTINNITSLTNSPVPQATSKIRASVFPTIWKTTSLSMRIRRKWRLLPAVQKHNLELVDLNRQSKLAAMKRAYITAKPALYFTKSLKYYGFAYLA